MSSSRFVLQSSAARSRRSARGRDFLRNDVGDLRGPERARFNDGGRSLSTAIRPKASDHHYVVATKVLTAAWGLIAIAVASFASLVENLIEAGNILASVFYGSILGLVPGRFLHAQCSRLGGLLRRA